MNDISKYLHRKFNIRIKDDAIYTSSDGKIVIKYMDTLIPCVRVYMNNKMCRVTVYCQIPEYVGGFEYFQTFTEEEKTIFANEMKKPYKKATVFDYVCKMWWLFYDVNSRFYPDPYLFNFNEAPDYTLLDDKKYLVERCDKYNPELCEGHLLFSETHGMGSFAITGSECLIPSIRIYSNEYGYLYTNDSKMCRLSMLEPKYVYGVGSDWVLTDEDKKEIMRLLNSVNPEHGNTKTVWEKIIEYHNFGIADMYENPIPKDLPIPDYTKLR